MNNIEILEKLKDEQYTEETLNTICKFYDEEFKPYVLTTIEREAIENLIQENKELNDKIFKMAMYGGSIKSKNYIEKNYIRKSKIEKLINELFEEMDELDKEEFDEDIVNEKRNLQDTIIVLKKLLQEGDVNNE